MNPELKRLSEKLHEYAYELAADYVDSEHEDLNETQRDDAIKQVINDLYEGE